MSSDQRVTAVIPAHNEAASIGATLKSLAQQGVRPGRVLVACDNCTDATANIAETFGAEAMVTVGNTEKKAGALNQALRWLSDVDEYILVMDADTTLSPNFIEDAIILLDGNPELGAVGAVFYGDEPTSLLQQMQANEYVRYARQLDRTRRVMVLSGTAALIRRSALEQVADERGRRLPGNRGDYYDGSALTEDMELTLALKTLGWKLASPPSCRSSTELMPSLGTLMNQRVRWYRGALENLPSYGFTRSTARYWGQQAMLCMSIIMMCLFLILTSAVLVAGAWSWSPFWLAIGSIFWIERVVSAWNAGPRGRILAALLFPEFGYDLVLMAAFLTAAVKSIRKSTPEWHHLEVAHV